MDLPKYEVPWLRVPELVDHKVKQRKAETTVNEGGDIQESDSSEYEETVLKRPRKKRVPFCIEPQVSYLQSPLLQYAPFVMAQV